MLRVAVVGGGPSGSCAAEVLAKAGIQTWLFERKLDNAKPCGGAIPLCMVDEFDIPDEIIDRFCVLGTAENHIEKLSLLRDMGVDQFAIYLMHDDEEGTLHAYGTEIISAVNG